MLPPHMWFAHRLLIRACYYTENTNRKRLDGPGHRDKALKIRGEIYRNTDGDTGVTMRAGTGDQDRETRC